MNIFRRFAVLGMCVAVLQMLFGCGGDRAAQPEDTTKTTSATPSSQPTTNSKAPTAPASTPASKTPKQTVKPSAKPSVKTTPPPTIKPVKPDGPVITVESRKPHSGEYTKEVRIATGTKDTLTCQSGKLDPVVLKRNGTVITDPITKDRVSTLVTKAGLLIFPQPGSVLPSDTLIAGKKLFGFVPGELLDPETSGTHSILLRSGSQKGGWGDITNPKIKLVVCHSMSKYR